MVCDTAWGLMTKASISDVNTYFSTRASQGFTAIFFSALVGPYVSGNANATTFDGIAPFTSGNTPATYDLATPNSLYFNRLLSFVQAAQAHGLAVLLDPIETGGWLQYMVSARTTKCFNYGAYLAGLLSTCHNVIWVHGNDYNKLAGGDGGTGTPGGYSGWSAPATDACVIAVANGIASVPSQLQSVELGNNSNATNFGQSESTDDGTWNSVLGFNWGYTYLPTYETAKVNWQNGAIPVMPYIFGEGQYENEGLEGTAFTLRKANWGTVCAGGAGFVFGTHQISIFTNFASNLSTPAELNTGYLANFFSNINWWLLVPDFGHSFLTSGWGTEFTNLSVDSQFVNGSTPPSWLAADNYVSSSLSSDASFGIAYLQTTSPVTVDLSKLTGPTVNAQWYDPSNNTYVNVAGSPFSRVSHVFTPTGNNSANNPDWVLLLTSSSTHALK
jgi:hypothetical protein